MENGVNRISLDQANRIITEAFKKGAELKLNPLSVVVLDPGGHVIAFQRQDGASIMRFQIAAGKAFGALALGTSSRKIGELAGRRPGFVASLAPIAPHGVIPAPGGIIVVDDAGEILGAVGITGDSSDNDEALALSSITEAGLMVQSS
jgi:uncharacterized protein GlcG (DUF336 family)